MTKQDKIVVFGIAGVVAYMIYRGLKDRGIIAFYSTENQKKEIEKGIYDDMDKLLADIMANDGV